MGLHVNSIDEYRGEMERKGYELIQEVVTQSHTSLGVSKDRRYHYAIYKHPDMRFFWKLIERIETKDAEQELEKIYDPVEVHLS